MLFQIEDTLIDTGALPCDFVLVVARPRWSRRGGRLSVNPVGTNLVHRPRSDRSSTPSAWPIARGSTAAAIRTARRSRCRSATVVHPERDRADRHHRRSLGVYEAVGIADAASEVTSSKEDISAKTKTP